MRLLAPPNKRGPASRGTGQRPSLGLLGETDDAIKRENVKEKDVTELESIISEASPESTQSGTWTFDAVSMRLRLWNSEFFFTGSELMILVIALSALGFSKEDLSELFSELRKGRRRDNTTEKNTPVEEILVRDPSLSVKQLRELQKLLNILAEAFKEQRATHERDAAGSGTAPVSNGVPSTDSVASADVSSMLKTYLQAYSSAAPAQGGTSGSSLTANDLQSLLKDKHGKLSSGLRKRLEMLDPNLVAKGMDPELQWKFGKEAAGSPERSLLGEKDNAAVEKSIDIDSFMKRSTRWLEEESKDGDSAGERIRKLRSDHASSSRVKGSSNRVHAVATSERAPAAEAKMATDKAPSTKKQPPTAATATSSSTVNDEFEPAAHLIAVDAAAVGELSLVAGTHVELSASNLLTTRSGTAVTVCPRGILLRPNSGLWYFELVVQRASSSGGTTCVGVVSEQFTASSTAVGTDAHGWGLSQRGLRHRGLLHNESASTAQGQWLDGDVLGCLVDTGRSELRFSRNGQELQAGAASFTEVRGQIGLCPALTIDCGFLGFLNLGDNRFRHQPLDEGVMPVHAFVQRQRIAKYIASSSIDSSSCTAATAVAPQMQMRARSNQQSVSIQRWPLDSPEDGTFRLARSKPFCWGLPTVSPVGVLMTWGKWYFEVELPEEGYGKVFIGAHDTQFKMSDAWSSLGSDKHSWAIEVGPWARPCLLVHMDKQQAWHSAFKLLQHGTIGCAIDADAGTIRYAVRDRVSDAIVCEYAFEGVEFAGGLIPSVSVLYAEPIVRFSGCKLLGADDAPAELADYQPMAKLLYKLASFPRGLSSSSQSLLVPSSGHRQLCFEDSRTVRCTSFVGSLTSPELRSRPGSSPRRYYFEVHLLRMGGVGAAGVFDLDAPEFNWRLDSKQDDGLDATLVGGPAAIGWATPRFKGEYYRSLGVGDQRFSWGYAGCKLRPPTGTNVRATFKLSGITVKLVLKAQPSGAQFVAFKSASARTQETCWPQKAKMGTSSSSSPASPTRPAAAASPQFWDRYSKSESTPLAMVNGESLAEVEPLWKQGGVVGCGITIDPDGTGKVDYYYNGGKVCRTLIKEPVLLDGVMPAISIHAGMRVRVNFGETTFVVGRDANSELKKAKDPPGAFLPAVRAAGSASKVAASRNAAVAGSSAATRWAGLNALFKGSSEDVAFFAGLTDRITSAVQAVPALSTAGQPNTIGEALITLSRQVQQACQVEAEQAKLADGDGGKPSGEGGRPSGEGGKPFGEGGRPSEQAAASLILDLSPTERSKGQLSGAERFIDLSSAESITAVFDVLEELPKGITSLNLRSTKIRPVSAEALAEHIEAQVSLEVLCLSHNACQSEGMMTLALALRSMHNHALRELDVSANDIGDVGVAALCSGLSAPSAKGKSGLLVLHLSQNSISATGAIAISDALERLPLRELYLDRNGLGPNGARHLARAIELAPDSRLEILSLSETGLLDEGVEALAVALGTNDRLVSLILGKGNRIEGPGLVTLARSLKENAVSRLSSLTLLEETNTTASVCLLFSLRAAIESAKAGKLDFGSLVSVSGSECERFFAGPLTFCVRSLSSHHSKWTELASWLTENRNRRGSKSYVGAADAQCALVEAVVLEDPSMRMLILSQMIGRAAGYGVRTTTLYKQERVFAQIQPLPLARQLEEPGGPGGPGEGGGGGGSLRKKPWLGSMKRWRQPHALSRRQLRGEAEAEEGLLIEEEEEEEQIESLDTIQEASVWGHTAQAGQLWQQATVRRVAMHDAAHLGQQVQLHSTMLRVSTCDVHLKHDLWSAAHPVNKASNGALLSEQAQLSMALHCLPSDAEKLAEAEAALRQAKEEKQEEEVIARAEARAAAVRTRTGRTALLVALHTGHEDAALLLTDRLLALRCFETAGTSREHVGSNVLRLRVTSFLRERLGKQGGKELKPLPNSCAEILVRQFPDTVGVDAAEHGEGERLGVEALRVAAVRGMARVVTALLAYRSMQGHATDPHHASSGRDLGPCRHVAGVCGMRVEYRDRAGRTILHDACRTLLPRGDGLQFLERHDELIELVREILSLTDPTESAKLGNLGKRLATEAKDNKARLPIHYASAFGHLEMTRLLLEAFMEEGKEGLVDATDADGWTPLALAVSNGHLRVSELLLEHGADPMAPLLLSASSSSSKLAPPARFLRARTAVSVSSSGERAPCAYVLALLRLHYEGTVRPAISVMLTAPRKNESMLASERKEGTGSKGTVAAVATAKLSTESRKHTRHSSQKDGKERGGSTGGGGGWSLTDQLAERSTKVGDGAQQLAERLVEQLLSHASTERYRRYFLLSLLGSSALFFFVYLLLLTAVALQSSGMGGWPGRRSSSGLSMPYMLTNDVGGALAGEDMVGEAWAPPITFRDVGGPDDLHGFLDPSAGPLFSTLLADPTGAIDQHNALLGAVRLRLLRSSMLSSCADAVTASWLGANTDARSTCANDRWYLNHWDWPSKNAADSALEAPYLNGSSSGRAYPFCDDGVFCRTSVNASDIGLRHLMGYYLDDRSQLGLSGYVIDLHPSNGSASSVLQALLEDGLLDDGMSRALFIDYTIHNPALRFAVVVHLTVEMAPSGIMATRTESVALPLHWPFDSMAELTMVVAEAVVILWTLWQLASEVLEFVRLGRTYFSSVWNLLDLIGLSVLLVWIIARGFWWFALFTWSGLDPGTVEYIGWFQPLSNLLRVQRTTLAFGLILQWLRLQSYLRLVPFFGPLLQAFFETLFSFRVLMFSAVTWAFAVIIGLGAHMAFGNDVERYQEPLEAVLSGYAAIFGDVDRDELASTETRMGDRSVGSLMWLLLMYLGVALLSNVFIAVVGDVYSSNVESMQAVWAKAVTQRMQKEVWLQVCDGRGTAMGTRDVSLKGLLHLLGQSKQLGQGGGVSGSGLWLRCLRWRRVIWMRRPLAWLIKQLLARVILQKTSRQASLIPWRSELGALRKRFACSSSGLETRAEDEDDVTDEELREIERQHCDSSLDHVREMRTRWFAQQVSASTPADAVSSAHNEQVTSGQSGARSALLVHDLQWYDQAVTLAFRHSWCVVRKWNAHEVALELETETDFRRRKKRAQLERFQSAAKGL